jgi:predicted transcriptional regulator
MRYRTRTEIISQILEAAIKTTANNYGVTKTQLMYMAYLSSAQLKEYLTILRRKNRLFKLILPDKI